jgi:hypothetical protein
VQIVVQVSLAQRRPLVPIQPDPFAAVAVIYREIKTAGPTQIPHHAEAAFRGNQLEDQGSASDKLSFS